MWWVKNVSSEAHGFGGRTIKPGGVIVIGKAEYAAATENVALASLFERRALIASTRPIEPARAAPSAPVADERPAKGKPA